ncbi:NosD domain-containing protein, partial [Desulfobacterales bacterium HSG17]|nr:NosD domain-containing protein [Desulfobacterales bacterium HSG17]
MLKKLYLSMALFLFLLIPLCTNAAVYTVSHLNDSTDTTDAVNYNGSLREAITKANETPSIIDRIEFEFPGSIKLTAPLPVIIDSQLTIDGTTAEGYADKPVVELDGTAVFDNGITINASGVEILGLSIHSFFFSEIQINGSDDNHIHNCCIGVNPDHTIISPNSPYGIVINNGSNNTINNNIIGGISTGSGVLITGESSTANIIKANFIGTDSGSMIIGNDIGISVTSGTDNNDIQNNTITNNKTGVIISGTGNRIMGNLIYGNDAAGIISADPKTKKPALINIEKDPASGEVKVSGILDADSGDYRIDFFASIDNANLCIDQGELLLGYLSSQISGDFTFSYNPPSFSYILSATATRNDTRENTSNFSCKNNLPVNIIPDPAEKPQKTDPGTNLVFSSANGNAIKVSDPDDPIGNTIVLDVIISIDVGEISSDGTIFSNSLIFSDTAANLNSELDGLIFKPGAVDATITVTAKDNAPAELGGAGIDTDDIIVLVSSTDAPPTTVTPFEDISLNQGTIETVIDITNVFTDADNADSAIIKSIENNTNPSLVTASIIANILTLTYQPEQTGTADITILAESNTKTVSETFTVMVKTSNHAPDIGNTILTLSPIVEDTSVDMINDILV